MINSISVGYDPDSFQVEGSAFTYDDLAWITTMFGRWEAGREQSPTQPSGEAVSLRITPFSLEGEGNFMLLLTVTQQCGLSLDPRDANGNPARLDGVPEWSSSDVTVATVEPAEDGLTAVVKAAGALGTTQINVLADARQGSEVVPLSGTLDVIVQAGEAVTLGISTDTPEEQGPVPTPV